MRAVYRVVIGAVVSVTVSTVLRAMLRSHMVGAGPRLAESLPTEVTQERLLFKVSVPWTRKDGRGGYKNSCKLRQLCDCVEGKKRGRKSERKKKERCNCSLKPRVGAFEGGEEKERERERKRQRERQRER